MTTRRSLLLTGLGALTTAAVGTRMTAYADPALQKVKVVIPQSSGRTPRAAAEPARSIYGGLLRHRRIRPVRRPQL